LRSFVVRKLTIPEAFVDVGALIGMALLTADVADGFYELYGLCTEFSLEAFLRLAQWTDAVLGVGTRSSQAERLHRELNPAVRGLR
jgi:hypothetical protein